MSFLLGILGGLGEIAATSTVEATGSTVLGDAASTAVNSQVAGFVNDTIDGALSGVIDTIFGSNKYEDAKKSFYSSIEEAKAIGLFTGDISQEKEVLQKIKDSNYTQSDLINEVHNFAHDFSDSVSKRGIDLNVPIDENSLLGDLFAKLSQTSPVYYYLTNKLLDKSAGLIVPTDDPEYQAVAAVYNGTGLYDQFTRINYDGSNTIFSIVDEAGEIQKWVYPAYNNYTVVSPLYGRWVGINSPNDGPPISGFVSGRIRESFLDKIAMMHDISYKNWGSFNKKGDYQLISRASQNKDKFVLPGEEVVANIAINYFSSLGAVTRKLMGPTEEQPIIKDLFKDVYGQEVSTEQLQKFIGTKVSYGDPRDQLASLINNLEIELD